MIVEDFGGVEYEGCNEYLVVMKLEVVVKVYCDFLVVGVDVVEIDSFGFSFLVFVEYNLVDCVYELSRKVVELVCSCVDEFMSFEKFRFVVGFIGLGIKLFIFGYIIYDELKVSFMV